MKIIITCEHGGNQIPEEYRQYFTKADKDLNSHRGIDYGAIDLFKGLTENYADFSLSSQVSRLLVELNRSILHENLFSVYTQCLPENIKEKILETYYHPYRNTISRKLLEFKDEGETVIHISVHTYTPVFNGELRKNDIGLLFDPKKKAELSFCNAWKESLDNIKPELVVKFNYPYTGTTDGLTKTLREVYTENYLGIELEVNQKFYTRLGLDPGIINVVEQSFGSVLNKLYNKKLKE